MTCCPRRRSCWTCGSDLGTLGFGDLGKDVAVEMHRAALISGLRERLGDRADHAGGLVAGEHLDAAQSGDFSHDRKSCNARPTP